MNNSGRRQYVNYRRRQLVFRRCVLLLSILVLSVAFSFGASKLITNATDLGDVQYYKYFTSVTVYPGDTLTSIAEEHLDNYDSIETYINEVKETNHLRDDKIIAGNVLIIPYYSTEFK